MERKDDVRKLDTHVLIYVIVASCYAVTGFWLYHKTGLFIHKAILWNLFLAFMPLILASWYLHLHKQGSKFLSWLVLFLWLLIFPNAPYMITDFIHITPILFYELTEIGTIYVQEILSWLQLLYLAIGIMAGLLAGIKSLDMILSIVKERYGTAIGFLCLLCISLFSGYGVFLGRFLRLNSWDIMQPWTLIQQIIQETNLFALQFSLVFMIFIMGCYGAYHRLHKS